MPLLSTRGNASARGFGFFSGKKLVTQDYYYGTNWTAPVGVTSVDVILRGSNLTPESWSYPFLCVGGHYTSATAPTVASCNTALDAWPSAASPTLNAGGSGVRTIVAANVGATNQTLSNGDVVSIYDTCTFYSGGGNRVIRNTFSSVRSGNAVINLSFKRVFNYFTNSVELLTPCSNGWSSSWFSQSASGGICPSTAPQTVSFSTSVTPGTSYYLSSNGGQNTISYLV